ncbi:hypothetical protein [Caulobacter sp. S45]|uniref:hypothetical protein n=1 Tax=Caulobacter sp. S45 TaxID=1641861 RepID=UPI00352FF6F9
MEFLDLDFQDALSWVSKSVAAIDACDLLSPSHVFRYEDGDIGTCGAILRVAALLGYEVSETQAEKIAEQLSASGVRRMIGELQQRGVIGGDGEPATFDPLTHWHPGHVGDGEVGKHARRLSPAQQCAVLEANVGFMQARYPNAACPPVRLPATIAFGRSTGASGYCRTGFSYPEDGATWTDDDLAIVDLPFQNPLQDTLNLTLWFTPPARGPSFRLSVNGIACAFRDYARHPGGPTSLDISISDPRLKGATRLEVKLEFCDLVNLQELGLSNDARRLGIMLSKLTVSGGDEGTVMPLGNDAPSPC